MTMRLPFIRSWLAIGVVATLVVGVGACSVRNPQSGADRRVNERLPQQTPADDVLRSRVLDALSTALDVNASRVEVEADAGLITVRGRVASGFEQQSVGAIVRAVPGVARVRFDLQVENPGAGR
jgi:osmotically-inducible protein OsmY